MEASKLLQINIGSGAIAYTLQKVANGSLRAYISANSRLQLGTLLFARSDIDMHIGSVKAENGWIDRDEVASILDIDIKSLVSWVRIGLISPVSTEWQTHYFDRQSIEKLKSTLVRTAEASNILGVHFRAVYSLVQKGRLKALRGPAVNGAAYYVFSRESLQEWKDAHASLKEAGQLLHMSEQKIVTWIKQGRMPPPEDEKQKPWFFSLQTLHRYKEAEQERSYPHIPHTDQAPEQDAEISIEGEHARQKSE